MSDRPSQAGTIFRITMAGQFTSLYAFRGIDGKQPCGKLMLARDGNFYGTTLCGGLFDTGTIYRSSGTLKPLHWFGGSEGAFPAAGLVQARDGNFYGTALRGGPELLAAGTVFKMTPTGTVTRLHAFASDNESLGTWPAGTLIEARRRIVQVPANGGAAVVVREGNNPVTWAHFLPDGRHFLYNVYDLKASSRQLFVGSLDSTDDVLIPGVSGRAEFAAGQLIFWREGGLVAQPFDIKTFRLSGEPVPLADDVHAFEATGFAAFSVASDLLVYQAGQANHRLVWFDRQGLEVGKAGPPKQYADVRLSPDGSKVAFAARDPRLGTNDIFVNELDRSLTRKLTSDRGTENGPLWSPDGRTIIYAADRNGPPSLHARNADGTGEERQIVAPANGPLSGGSVTPDGRSLVFLQPNPGTNYDIMIVPFDDHTPPVAIVKTKGRETSARVSPDGQWIAYASNESGRTEVFVQGLLDGRGRRQVSSEGGSTVRWRGDGKELYFIGGSTGNHVMAASVVTTGRRLGFSGSRE